jgi:hypothetical protein
MAKLGPRPKDFYGFDDWSGADPQDDIDRITEAQVAWDAAYAALPWWRRWFGLY